MQPLALATLFALLGSTLGCQSTAEAPQVVVSVRSDLQPGDDFEFVRVSMLDEADTPRQTQWFGVFASCGAPGQGLRTLLAFAVERFDTARFEVTALSRDRAGTLVPRVSQRIELARPERPSLLSIDLVAACSAVDCAPTQTCTPERGRCGAIPRAVHYERLARDPATLDCIGVLAQAPVPEADAGPEEPPCGASDDPSHCGACDHACGGEHVVSLACEGGACLYECGEGYEDCDREARGINGCETHIAQDDENCGECGLDCTGETGFPFCGHHKCATPFGSDAKTASLIIQPGTVVGIKVGLRHGTVLALGAQVRPVDREHPGEILLGLAEVGVQHVRPGDVVTQSTLLTVRDARVMGQSVGRGFTYAHVPEAGVTDGEYFVLIQGTKAFELFGSDELVDVYEEQNVPTLVFEDQQFYGASRELMKASFVVVVSER